MNPASPMAVQIGGKHYKSLAVQPAEFWIRNQLPATEGAIVKYLTRHRFKHGREDCDKALHFAEMLQWWYFDAPSDRVVPRRWRSHHSWEIPPRMYCEANKLLEEESAAILLICDFSCREHFVVICDLIRQIIARDYAEPLPLPALSRGEVMFLAKEHLEAYSGVLKGGPLPARSEEKLIRVDRIVQRLRLEWPQ